MCEQYEEYDIVPAALTVCSSRFRRKFFDFDGPLFSSQPWEKTLVFESCGLAADSSDTMTVADETVSPQCFFI